MRSNFNLRPKTTGKIKNVEGNKMTSTVNQMRNSQRHYLKERTYKSHPNVITTQEKHGCYNQNENYIEWLFGTDTKTTTQIICRTTFTCTTHSVTITKTIMMTMIRRYHFLILPGYSAAMECFVFLSCSQHRLRLLSVFLLICYG